jgi:hypothetical protein
VQQRPIAFSVLSEKLVHAASPLTSWLVANPERSSGDIFRELQHLSPGRYQPLQIRTLQGAHPHLTTIRLVQQADQQGRSPKKLRALPKSTLCLGQKDEEKSSPRTITNILSQGILCHEGKDLRAGKIPTFISSISHLSFTPVFQGALYIITPVTDAHTGACINKNWRSIP